MISADEPVVGRDLASCNECGALMPVERRGLHQSWHEAQESARASLAASLEAWTKNLAEQLNRALGGKRRR